MKEEYRDPSVLRNKKEVIVRVSVGKERKEEGR